MRALGLLLFAGTALSQTLVLQHVNVIDATGSPAKADQTVIIKDGVISAVGRNIAVPTGDVRVVNASGKFLIPGLWDMHTHVAGITADPQWGKTLLPQYLAYGITGIRDMAGDVTSLLDWKKEQDDGKLLGPRMFISGPFVDSSKNGFTYPGDVIEATTPAAARETVRVLKQKGVDFIKIGSQLSRETFLAIAEECKLQRIPFLGHVPDSVTPLEASVAGIKSQEHLFGIALSVSRNEDVLRKEISAAREHNDSKAYSSAMAESQSTLDEGKARALFDAFKQNGTWIVPTLVWTEVTSTLSQRTTPGETAWDKNLNNLPDMLRKKWAPGNHLISEGAQAYYARKLQSDVHIVQQMHQAGVRLLAGSDSLDPYVFPGESLHRELELLVKAGLSPMEALQTATVNPAQFFGLQNDLGTIEVGKKADLVLLEADPLQEIGNTRKIAAIIQDGRYRTPQEVVTHAEGAWTQPKRSFAIHAPLMSRARVEP